MGLKAFDRLSKDPQITKEVYHSDDYQMLGPKYLTKKQKDQILQKRNNENLEDLSCSS